MGFRDTICLSFQKVFLLTGSFLFHHRTQNSLTGTCLITKWTNLNKNRRTASLKGQLQSADGQERKRGKTPWIAANTNVHGGGHRILKLSSEKTFQMIAWIRSVSTCRQDCWGKVTSPAPQLGGASCHCSPLCSAKLDRPSQTFALQLVVLWTSLVILEPHLSESVMNWGKSMWLNVTWRTF